MFIKNESEWIWRELVRAYRKDISAFKKVLQFLYRPLHALRIQGG
jgi:hypothetical protein